MCGLSCYLGDGSENITTVLLGRNVHEQNLIQSTRSQYCWINYVYKVKSVSCQNFQRLVKRVTFHVSFKQSERYLKISYVCQPAVAVSRSIVSEHLPGLLVAPMMKTCFLDSNPSISVSSWFTTRTLAPPCTTFTLVLHHFSLWKLARSFIAFLRSCFRSFSTRSAPCPYFLKHWRLTGQI